MSVPGVQGRGTRRHEQEHGQHIQPSGGNQATSFQVTLHILIWVLEFFIYKDILYA